MVKPYFERKKITSKTPKIIRDAERASKILGVLIYVINRYGISHEISKHTEPDLFDFLVSLQGTMETCIDILTSNLKDYRYSI